MKTLSLHILILLSLTFGAFAAEKNPMSLTVAVYDFTDAENNSNEFGGKVTALVTADLTTETNFVMVERSDLKKALGEQAIGISGMVNSDQAARIGQLTGAKVLVSGQIIKTGKGRLVIIANIVGTESGRLFAEKIEGASENFADLASEMSKKIAHNISDHKSAFITDTLSHDDVLARILKGIKGTNRPTVSVNLHFPNNAKFPSSTATGEMGLVLQKTGFTVVDARSEQKPDIEMTGVVDVSKGPQRGNLMTFKVVVDIKVQERRTGKIIAFDRQTAEGVDVSRVSAERSAMASAVDILAERILPVLAQ